MARVKHWAPEGYLALQDVALWAARFHRYGSREPSTQKRGTSVECRRGVSGEVFAAEDGPDETIDSLRVLVEFELRCEHMDPRSKSADPGIQAQAPGDSVQYIVEAAFALSYVVYRMPDKRELEEFIQFNCVHYVWPLWQQHVVDVLTRASLPIVAIPVIARWSRPFLFFPPGRQDTRGDIAD